MPLLVVGSIALDCVETPSDRRDDVLGGSAVFFSYAASFFSPVKLIGAVGEDWPAEHTRLLEGKGIDTAGLELIPGGRTFRWRGRYLPNMNDRETLEVHLNVLETFRPKLNGDHRDCKFLFSSSARSFASESLSTSPSIRFRSASSSSRWMLIQRSIVSATVSVAPFACSSTSICTTGDALPRKRNRQSR